MKKLSSSPATLAVTLLLIVFTSSALAQNAIQLFGPTNVRASQNGATFQSPVTFNSATLNLACAAGTPITAVLSSTQDGKGNVLVDNYINVTPFTANGPGTPVNVCQGGVSQPVPGGTVNNCFNQTYEFNAVNLLGQNLDGYAATGGIAPIDVSSLISQSAGIAQGAGQTKFDLVDAGVELASTTLYLVTSCTQAGVTGPATVTGNPISSSNPTPQQLTQDFTFNPTKGQDVGFLYDLSTAESNGKLQITDSTIPTVSDTTLDPALWQPNYASGTSFATSNCLIHTGELLNGQPACKLYTLTCQVGTGSASAGALCPVSQIRNELFQDQFSGPAFTLPDITGPNGKTYHQGVGFLMSQDGWTGGPCSFDPATGLGLEDCPQNLLTNFTLQPQTPSATSAALKPGSAIKGAAVLQSLRTAVNGTATRPNSTYISVGEVPEDLTTVLVQGQHAGGWTNSRSATVTFSSEPPVLPNTVANYQNFVASPIHSITYGLSPTNAVPSTTFAVPGDITLTNPVSCPAPLSLTTPPATDFTPAPVVVTVPADGQYLIHYFAQDCAGTEELKFVPTNGGYLTTFFTAPINVDTVPPVVASGPTLSSATGAVGGAQNTYYQGAQVTATYRCTDENSGVATCGGSTFSSPGTLDTGNLTSTVDTSSPGTKTFTVQTTDIAGNVGTPASITYHVVGGEADLEVVGFAPLRVETEATLTYEVIAVDLGPSAASNVVITDKLPRETTLISAEYEDISCALFGSCSIPPNASPCTADGNVLTCRAGTLQPIGGSSLSAVAVKIVVRVNAPAHTSIKNHVTVTSANPDKHPGNNSLSQLTRVTRED